MSEIPAVTLRDTGQTVDALTYLKCVLPAEMPASWPAEALRAQCVAAASYAASKGWTVYPDTRDQAYDSSRRNAKTDAIVDEMAGVLLWQGDKPVRAYYSAYCGGQHLAKWGSWLRAGRCYCPDTTSTESIAHYKAYGGGHKNGLCQQGARAIAGRGYTWDQILAWYYDLGDSVELRGDWGARRLWLPPDVAPNRITLHVQRNAYPVWLKSSLARLGARVGWIVCIDPPLAASPFPAQRMLARLWIGGDDVEQTLIDGGTGGADRYWQQIRERIPGYVYAVLGPNEPRIENTNDRQLLTAFYVRLCELAHGAGIRIAGPNAGVGRLGNDTRLSAIQGWGWLDTMRVVAQELEPLYRAVDVATDHAYGRRLAAEWSGWDDWTLRQRLFMRHLPYDLQRDIVWVCTEGGLDIAGGPDDGWLGPGGPNGQRYLAQIQDANRRLPPQVRGYALFTALPEPRWATFAVGEATWALIERWILSLDDPTPPTTTLGVLATANRWQQEEAVREIARGAPEQASDRLRENIALRAYPLELATRGR